MSLNLNTIDWAAISSIITFIMVIATFISLKHNREQLKEIKRQWQEENRARLNFSIVSNNGLFLLKISNIGNNNAYDIKLKFSDCFLNCLYAETVKNNFVNLERKSFIIEAGVSKYIYLSPIYGDSRSEFLSPHESFTGSEINKWLDKNRKTEIEIIGTYCNKYKINENFTLDDFLIESIVVNDELTNAVKYIKKGLIVQNDKYMPIQKSLDLIAKNIIKDR